jgi:hypothetical protein
MLTMVENKISTLGEGLSLQADCESLSDSLQRGANVIHDARAVFAAGPRGEEYLDFEVIKIASLLATAQAAASRAEADWPHPDFWGGDVTAFPDPF